VDEVTGNAGQDGTLPPEEPVRPEAMSALLRDLLRQDTAPGKAAFVEPAPGVMVGRFELVKELGRGGFGVVYEARDVQLRRSVAVKLLRVGGAGLSEQLEREAELVARLSHPNLVTIFDVGLSEHGPYLVLELLQGQTLQQRLDVGPLSPREAVHVAVEVARGLAYAHADGVVHRDLKPSNVFLCERDQVKILDFGMAHAFGRKRVSGGTPAYMAPEQWAEGPEDERTDLFALGVMLYRMLAGEYPFPEDGGRWASGPGVAKRLEVPGARQLGGLVGRLLEKSPARRPRDAVQVLESLEQSELALAPRPRRRAASLLGGVALVAALAGVGWSAWTRDGATGRGAPPPAPSIAVLPFADMSPGHDQAYFADGMAEEILNALAHVEGLRVPGRTSSFWFQGKNVELAEIGRKLNVTHVLEGSVRREGQRLRITAQVVKVADGFHLWSETFDRGEADVFAVQAQVAKAVAEALQVKLLPGSRQPGQTAATASLGAYEQYLLGTQLLARYTQKDIRNGIAALEKAVKLDPKLAPAWASLAYGLYSVIYDWSESAARGQRAVEAAERAVKLDPDYAEGYASRVLARMEYQGDYRGASEDSFRAMALAPRSLNVLLNHCYVQRVLGRLEESLAACRTAVDLDPLSTRARSMMTFTAIAAGDLALARAVNDRALELSPDSDMVLWNRCALDILEEKQAAARLHCGSMPDEEVRMYWMAMVAQSFGTKAEADQSLAAYIARAGESDRFGVAEIYGWRGDAKRAWDWMEKAQRNHEGMSDLKGNWKLRKVVGDPRYRALLKTANLPVD
jgi:serine/threonine-protein kinase